MRFLLPVSAALLISACQKQLTFEQITQEHAYKLLKRTIELDMERPGPKQDMPFSAGPTKPDIDKALKLSKTVTALQQTVITKGSGPIAKDGDFLTVYYRGELLDGFVFDANAKAGGAPFIFQLGKGRVIKGWDIAFKGMRVGETRKIVVPANLAYGSQSPTPNIPPNAALVFYVSLQFVGKTP